MRKKTIPITGYKESQKKNSGCERKRVMGMQLRVNKERLKQNIEELAQFGLNGIHGYLLRFQIL